MLIDLVQSLGDAVAGEADEKEAGQAEGFHAGQESLHLCRLDRLTLGPAVPHSRYADPRVASQVSRPLPLYPG